MTEIENDVKVLLFARWILTCYGDTEKDGISVLNAESGEWWKKQLKYFNGIVYPNYLENGTVEDTEKYLNDM